MYELHEFEIMKQIVLEGSNEEKQTKLFHALNGRKPFRTLKDLISELYLLEMYYRYCFLKYIEIVRTWCTP